jgi:hypothetical protein
MKRDEIRAELERLKRDGMVKAADVVDAARDEDSPLHSHFTWDDSDAAHQYRLEEARRLLRVFVVTERREVGDTRAYISLSPDRRIEGGGYRILADVMDNEELSAQMLSDALADLRRVQQKYRSLTKLAKVWKAIGEAETEFSAEEHLAA